MTTAPPPAWMRRRDRLHAQYASHSGLVDASRLAFLHGPRRTIGEAELHAAWDNAPSHIGDSEARNHIYVHVPFCKSICSFCNYVRLRPASKSQLEDYTERTLAQIAARAPHAAHLEFSSIYFGGGTPSVLSADQLDRIMGALHDQFRFHPQAGRHMEFDPAAINERKLAVAVKHGFKRYSFGIQTLDTDVNIAHNRGAQSREILRRRFKELQDAKVDERNCDLLLGLAGTTPKQMLEEIEEILSQYQPTAMHVFLITPTDSYVADHFDASYDAFWAHLKTFEADAIPHIPAIGKRFGYRVDHGGGHLIRLERVGARSSQSRAYCPMSHLQRLPVNVMAFGPSARGSIFGALQYQNMQTEDDWHVEGHSLTLRDEARVHMCMDLRDTDAIDERLFQQLHGTDFVSRFPEASEALSAKGLFDGAARFQPQSRLERTQTLMWLVDEERIEDEVARHLGFDRSPQGLRRLFNPVSEGQALPGGAVFEGYDTARLRLSHGAGQAVVRVAPPWEEHGRPRFVVESSSLAPDPLKRALKVLLGIARRNP